MNHCTHEETRLRLMTHCNQIRQQCLYCGTSVGNPIKHQSLTAEERERLEPFDYELRDLMERKRIDDKTRLAQSIAAECRQKLVERRTFYEDYLRSDAWRAKRHLVIERERGLCQGCRNAPIQEIHHLSYDHLGDELLFELIGLCRECHKKAHQIEQ